MNDDHNAQLLKLLATSMLLGGGANALFKTLGPGKKPFNPQRDIPSVDAGSMPVYVDVTPEQAGRYEHLTGLKAAAYTKTADQGPDYNWLTKSLVGGAGAATGWSVVNQVLAKIRKRNLDKQLSDAQSELAGLYGAKPTTDVGVTPDYKKLGSLHEAMDVAYTLFQARSNTKLAGEIKTAALQLEKNAGIIDSVGEAVAAPITAPVRSVGSYTVKSMAPILAAIALMAGYSAYNRQAPVAGKRRDLSAIARESRDSDPKPYVELRPRVVQVAHESDPAKA